MVIEREWTRRLSWDGCLNARDLGGYPTADGGQTRWGRIVRSDNLTPLSESGREALIAYGIRSIVDLRMPSELAAYPDPFAEPGAHGISYRNVSFIDPAAGPLEGVSTTLADEYVTMLDRFSASVAKATTAIANAPEGGVLIHCMGGKDRTGLVSALLLDLAGVPRQSIGEDYALTAECLRPREEEWLENGPGDRAERERILVTYAPLAEVMVEVLEHLDERHGGVEGYLREAGVSSDDLARIRERLLGDAG